MELALASLCIHRVTVTTPCLHHRQPATYELQHFEWPHRFQICSLPKGRSAGRHGDEQFFFVTWLPPMCCCLTNQHFQSYLMTRQIVQCSGSMHILLLYGVSEQTISSRFSASRAMLSAAAKPTDILWQAEVKETGIDHRLSPWP